MSYNPIEKYGIKEVADVFFYEIYGAGEKGEPALYLDTLKVSTIEQNAEIVEAKGGKGNPTQIVWDSNKEITLAIQDALFSGKSLGIMLGGEFSEDVTEIEKTLWFSSEEEADEYFTKTGTDSVMKWNGFTLTEDGVEFSSVDDSDTAQGVYASFTIEVAGKTMEIHADDFPGEYYVVGDTYARSRTGEDDFFQFVAPRAKILLENTITMEADGDPTVFDMNLKVLKPMGNKPMLSLTQYKAAAEEAEEDTTTP